MPTNVAPSISSEPFVLVLLPHKYDTSQRSQHLGVQYLTRAGATPSIIASCLSVHLSLAFPVLPASPRPPMVTDAELTSGLVSQAKELTTASVLSGRTTPQSRRWLAARGSEACGKYHGFFAQMARIDSGQNRPSISPCGDLGWYQTGWGWWSLFVWCRCAGCYAGSWVWSVATSAFGMCVKRRGEGRVERGEGRVCLVWAGRERAGELREIYVWLGGPGCG